MRSPLSWNPPSIVLTLLVAAAYCATGKLALLFAIPSGHATAVWPPAGIALAACLLYGKRVWPGILLGSCIVNIATPFDAASQANMVQWSATTVPIAFGAVLQAVLVSMLLERFAPTARELTNERQVFSFFALAGPIGCLINATVSVTVLVGSHIVSLSNAAFIWWTWWVGDTIGVLVFTPLMLMWLDQEGQWQQRRWAVTIPLVAMLTVAALVFVYATNTELRELRTNFSDQAARMSSDIERRLAINSATLRAVGGFFVASKRVEPEEFAKLADLLLPAHPEMRTLTWAPRVPREQRSQFEAAMRERGLAHGIMQHASAGLASAEGREHYYPIVMSAGQYVLSTALGFDLASESAPRAAIETAAREGKVTATDRMTIRDSDVMVNAVTIVVPIDFENGGAASELQLTSGVVLGTLRIDELIAHALSAEDRRHVLLSIEDVTDAGSPQPLFRSNDAGGETTRRSVDVRNLVTTRAIRAASREWLLTFVPSREYVSGSRSFVAWLVFACGLAITALVGAGALILTGRTKEIGALVRTRTEELALINEKLADEIGEHVATESELNSEREFLQTVLENLNEGILVYDAAGALTMTNRAARELRSRLVGEPGTLSNWHQGIRLFESDGRTPIAHDALPRSRALRGETVRDLGVVAAATNGPPLDLMLTAQPLVDVQGTHNGAIVILRDITATKRADRMKSEFVSVVSHELRTPLTSIRGSLGLACGGTAGELPLKARHLLEIAYRNTDRLTLLINDILDIEKVESGKTRFDLQTTLLAPLLEQAIEANAAYAASCEVQLQLHHPIPSAYASVDANRLLQVMANLLSNAAKFSPRGATVDVTVTTTATHVRVCVRDDGAGIPLEFQPRVFQKFSQADGSDSRSKPGTGLGLAISKALIERMNGTIGFESQPGCGALFFFDLPLVAVESEA